MAREIAKRKPPTIPGRAAGISTFQIVSDRVAPSAVDQSISIRDELCRYRADMAVDVEP